MEVTCKFTGEKIKKDEAFGVSIENKKNKYYFKSEQVYKIWLIEEEAEEKIQIKINEILGVYKYAQPPVSFKAKMKLWKKSYKLVEILFTIEKVEKELRSNIHKGINYLTAIIDNNLFIGTNILKSKIDIIYDKINTEICEKTETLLNSNKFLGNRIDISNL